MAAISAQSATEKVALCRTLLDDGFLVGTIAAKMDTDGANLARLLRRHGVEYPKNRPGVYVRTEEIREKMSKSHKGATSWIKGKSMSEEQKKKLSIAKTGTHPSIETRGKMSQTRKGKKRTYSLAGEKNPNWKGGITPENLKIRGSIELRLWREAVLARDNWTCQDCGGRGKGLCSHHIKTFKNYPELRSSIMNGIALCKTCHIKVHSLSNKVGEAICH